MGLPMTSDIIVGRICVTKGARARGVDADIKSHDLVSPPMREAGGLLS